MKTSELLLPVGNMEMLLAAIHNGADAVYIGVPEFNARGRTKDYTIEELKEMIELAHLYGVKVHLAFNVLIFENELEKAKTLLQSLIPLGPDAFIVQDLGLAQLIRQMSPDQTIHASTQMTISNHEAMEILDDLKIDRFVLAREVSIDEMKIIRNNTSKELEVFVHGALCVSYSGQCLTSESIGGRSANRGQCAQSCRLDYEMIVDGKPNTLISEKYFVSPTDLCAIDEVKNLQSLGINSLKVEGRLKSKEYVASTALYYNQALHGDVQETMKQEMGITYSRGFTQGWLQGVNHQELVNGSYSAHQGHKIGPILTINRAKKSISIISDYPLSLGDGLLFTQQGKEDLGGAIFEIKTQKDNQYEIAFANHFKLDELTPSYQVFINSSAKLEKKLNQNVNDKNKQKKIPLTFNIKAQINSPLEITVSDSIYHVTEKSETNLQLAQKCGLKDKVIEELKSLGGTCFSFASSNTDIADDLYLNPKELKQLRQKLIKKLTEQRISPQVKAIFDIDIKTKKIEERPQNPKLNVLIRHKEQIQYLNPEITQLVYLDFEYGKDYKEAVKELKNLSIQAAIATTRILKPLEYQNLKILLNACPDQILVRNLGALNYFNKQNINLPMIADYTFNCTNHLTGQYLLSKNLQRLTPSYDLNQWQLYNLIENISAQKLEVTIHQYLPEFHMEHCVFAGFLSQGTNYKNCGIVCDKHQVELKDPYGNIHVLKPDQECRNTMYRGTPQSAGLLIPELIKKGVSHYRLEALNEPAQDLSLKIKAYHDFLLQKISYEELNHKVQVQEKYGIFSGQLLKNKNYHDRKKEY